MRIGILEDDQQDAQRLAGLVMRWNDERGMNASIAAYSNATAFASAAAHDSFHVALLDCYLGDASPCSATPAITGMDVARELRKKNSECAIIFTTSSIDFAVEGYEVRALGYLIKPVDANSLAATLDRAVASLAPAQQAPGTILSLTTAEGPFRVASKNIAWARSRGHYIDFTLRDGSTVRSRMATRELAGALASDSRFYSPARGYLVNLDEVSGINGFDFVLANGGRVPISQTALTAARTAYA